MKTSNGKPRAIITAITEMDFEDYLLDNSPAFQKMLEKAHEEYLREGAITLVQYRKQRKLSA